MNKYGTEGRLPLTSWTALITLLVALALAYTACEARAQCGPGGCAPTFRPDYFAPQLLLQVQAAPRWVAFPDSPDWYGLMRGGVQLGTLDPDGVYRPLRGNTFGVACEPPIARPISVFAPKLSPQPQVIGQNFGIKTDELGKGPRYTLNGIDCTKAQAFAAIGAGLVDDSKLMDLTLIGTEADRKRALGELFAHPEWSKVRPLVKLTGRNGTGYDPGDWQVRFRKLASGKPAVYLQQPDGTVTYHAVDWKGAAEVIDAALNRKKPAPAPNPNPAPDPNVGPALPTDWRHYLRWLPWVAVAGALALLFWRTKT